MKYTQNQAIVGSMIILVFIMFPVVENWREKPKDSFPLSYYPMFSHKRGATYGVYYFVGYDSAENRYKIPYKLAGTGGFNQVRRQIKKKARSTRAKAFTQQVAERVTKQRDYPFNQLVRIELVKGYYHLENYFVKNDTLPTREYLISYHKIEM